MQKENYLKGMLMIILSAFCFACMNVCVRLAEGLKHEQYVTSLIHNIYDAAYSVKDFRTMQFLDWFVKEQGEEETNADGLVKKFELFGDDPKSLYMLDSELGARVYSAPSLVL